MKQVLCILLLATAAAPGMAQECSYGTAYGHVFDTESGEEVNVTPDNLIDRLSVISSCFSSVQGGGVLIAPFDDEKQTEAIKISTFLLSLNRSEGELSRKKADLAWVMLKRSGFDLEQIEKHIGLSVNGAEWKKDLHPQFVDQYISDCRAANVPVPGPIGGIDWSDEIDISDDATLIFSTAKEMSIWLHGIDENGNSTSEGSCVAFKRVLSGDIPVGTICMNEDRSKACFFDNLKYVDGSDDTERMELEETLTSQFSEMAHVLDSENCSSCHIGDNPLLLHPGTTLHKIFGSGTTKHDDFDFVEFVDGGWCNPDVVASNDGCNRCHDIALSSRPVARNYCSVLKLAANRTMPPSRHAGHSHISLWPDENGNFEARAEVFEDFFSSLRELGEMCRGLGGQTGTCSD